MKKPKKRKPVWHPIEMLKAHEALDLADANYGVAAKKAAQQRAAEGAASLRECLIAIKEASKDGLTEVNIPFHGNSIATNALKGMGYRVQSDDRWNIQVWIRWDRRPEDAVAGLLWDFLNHFWRTTL